MLALKTLAKQFNQFAQKIKDELNQLDAAQGDGDLGVTIVNGAKALAETTKKADSISDWFLQGGKAFRKAAPSTMGILLASALIKVGKEYQDKEDSTYTLKDFADIQNIMIQEIQSRGGAKLGDKTILDAFIPASEKFSESINMTDDLTTALKLAATSAKNSAENTKELEPKTGRSRWLGKRSKGKIDGGAWFCYLTYQFLYESVKLDKQKASK